MPCGIACRRSSALHIALSVSLLALLYGCGKPAGRPTVSVSGVVTLGGKPLADAQIYFFTDKFSSYGKTAADGSYHLIQGALPGTNRVFISKVEGADVPGMEAVAGDPEQLRVAAESGGAGPGVKKPVGPRQVVPVEFSNPEKTKLEFAVPPEGTTTADFRL